MAKKMKKLFAMLLTVCMVMSLLSVAASAESTDYQCGKNEHVHGETCYTTSLICEKHVHDETCYDADQNLVCTTLVGQDLICTKNEHAHTVEAGCYHKHSIAGGCYELGCGLEAGELTYTIEEKTCPTEEHAHGECRTHVCTDACSGEGGCTGEPNTNCSAEEHSHSDACSHSHTASCSHSHVDGCYGTEAKCGKGEDAQEANLVCDDEVHTHENTDEQTCFVPHVHSGECYSEPSLTCNAEEHTHVAGCAYGEGVVAATDFGTADQEELQPMKVMMRPLPCWTTSL